MKLWMGNIAPGTNDYWKNRSLVCQKLGR